MINCIIIDDESLAQEDLVNKINKIQDLEILGVFNSALDAVSLIDTGKVDLVFCDIQMPDINGISFLKSLRKHPLFIFITGNPNYAVESYELDVLDYILKPFGLDRLLKSVNKARTVLESQSADSANRDFLMIKDRATNIIMPLNDIFFIKSDRDYIRIATLEKEYVIYKRLADIEDELSTARQFLRVQKSYIINLTYAKHIEGNLIKMRGSIEDIPIGGQYKAELYKRLGIIGGN